MRHASMVAHDPLIVRPEPGPRPDGAVVVPGCGSYHRAMHVRDLSALERVQAQPFDGYSVRPRWALSPEPDRVVACVALLGTMIVSGILLGRPRT